MKRGDYHVLAPVGADLVSALSGESVQGRHKVCPYGCNVIYPVSGKKESILTDASLLSSYVNF